MAKTASPKRVHAPKPRTAEPEPLDPQLLRRVVVENIYPEVDGGRFPVKRTIGESVVVNADIHADGHDLVAAALLLRRAGEESWTEVRMAPLGNDRFTATFAVDRLGIYEYTVEGWIDRFGTWRSELTKKAEAAQDVASELLEGADLVRRTPGADDRILQWAATLADGALPQERRVVIALNTDSATANAIVIENCA